MTVRYDFIFIGGDPAIDFLNTEVIADGEPRDRLVDDGALSAWLAAAGFGKVPAGARSLASVKRFRGDFRDLVVRLAAGHSPAKRDLELINDALGRGKGVLQLRPSDGVLHVAFEPVDPDPLFLMARAAAEFLAQAGPARIRRCEGTNCILLFYDTTKSGTRRWCSMAGCGNRMKAALHYARQREGRE